jgi:midasin
LGDALKEIQRRFDEIQGRDDTNPPEGQLDGTMDVAQVEYAHPEDDDHDMQALGSAGTEQVARLSELKIVDDEIEGTAPMDVDPPLEREMTLPHLNSTISADSIPDMTPDHAEDAIIQSDPPLSRRAVPDPSDPSGPPVTDAEAPTNGVDEDEVEVELRRWQAEGQPSEGAEHIWRLYESLTHSLAYALCEQLRLILEPTLATRLRGDYRTGKRLNMRRIISYIASDYTKDKIWLRRTRPSQREYQVLIALDDSRSMAESHSIHLAYQTLALVSKALSRLEVGDIAIVKFGQAVDVLHGFDNGPFTDRAGTKVMDAFRFNQTATNVLSLVETSLNILQSARERASAGSSAGDLWQLDIIISDGICQDHDRLRTVLRKAEEQRVMVVFIIIDSLHSAAPTSNATPSTQTETSAAQNSILSMKQASYKNVDGRMELQLQRYLDSFPFEYYVVLRNVEALPDVLSSTLRQFFERVSEE